MTHETGVSYSIGWPDAKLCLPLFIVIVTLYWLFSTVQNRLENRRYARFARANNAQFAKSYPTRFYGLDNMISTFIRSRRGDDLLDDILAADFAKMKSWTFRSDMGGVELIQTAEPDICKAVLAVNHSNFTLGPLRQKQFAYLLGRGIFNSEGPEWQHARAMFRPIFARDAINDLEETDRACRVLLEVLPKGDAGWTKAVDLAPLFYRFTLDTATSFIFGQSVESQTAAINTSDDEKKQAEFKSFSDAFGVAQRYAAWRIRSHQFYWLVDSLKLRRSIRTIRNFANRVITGTMLMAADEEKKTDHQTKYSIVERLYKATQDPVVILDNVISLLFAGRDTTSALLAWLFLSLANHPEIYTKLRSEVIEHFGSEVHGLKILEFADIKSCRYLQHVIAETLRLYPTVPVNVRYVENDCVLPVGAGLDGSQPLAVKKGMTIAMMTYIMQRRKDIWGSDADEFRPERFENLRKDWSYIPFSGGPRICLGQQYAITEASYMVIRLVQSFESIRWEGESDKPVKGIGLSLWPLNGCPVRLKYAK